MKKTIGKETTELTTEYGTDDYKFMHDMFIENSYLTLNRDGVYDLDYQVIEEKIFQIGCNKLGAQFILKKKKVEEKSLSFLRGFYDGVLIGKHNKYFLEGTNEEKNDYIKGFRVGTGRDE